MKVQKLSLVILAWVFTIILNGYLFVQSFLKTKTNDQKLVVGDSCDTPAQPVKKENPNKMLFISCSGFLD